MCVLVNAYSLLKATQVSYHVASLILQVITAWLAVLIEPVDFGTLAQANVLKFSEAIMTKFWMLASTAQETNWQPLVLMD